MQGQDRLAVFGEQHEVCFPVSRVAAIGGGLRSFNDWDTGLNVQCRGAAPASAEAAFALAAGQIAAPAIVLGAGDLSVDEAVDALVADHAMTGLMGEPSRDLLG